MMIFITVRLLYQVTEYYIDVASLKSTRYETVSQNWCDTFTPTCPRNHLAIAFCNDWSCCNRLLVTHI